MSFHSASKNLSGDAPRYAWVSAFFDQRARDLPHKLYQRTFSPEFVDAMPPALRPVVDWVGPFVRDYIDDVGDYEETQFWVYGARRQAEGGGGAAKL